MSDDSFMKSLFFGVIDERAVFPFPEPSEGEADKVGALLESIRRFCSANVDSAAIDAARALPPEVLRGLKELGLFGLQVPVELGGSGLSSTGCARVIQEIGGIDPAIGVTLAAHQSIGYQALLLFGTEEQKRRYLPRLASGEHVAAYALTEAGAGSDAAAIQTRADRKSDGSYVLRGTKVWITNGGIADLFTVFARTSREEEGAKPRITAFLVERGPGVETGPNEEKLGVRGASTTTVHFEDVRVPAENVLGEVGRGFKVAVEVLNAGRVGRAAGAVGGCKRLIKLAVERVQERKAFGRPIGEFGLVKDKIATMMAETYALESMSYLTTGLVDRRIEDYSVESAICKVFGSEVLCRVANEALAIAAGSGYLSGSPFERWVRDSRVDLVFEGTNEILRCFIALSGMQGPGRTLVDVTRAIREPIKGFGLLSEFAIRKARTALGRERLTRAHSLLNREVVVFEQGVADLAKNVDKVLRKHGKDIAEMQYTQRRVADMAIELYAIAAVLSRTTRAIDRRGEEGARRELDCASTFVAASERRLAEITLAFDRNDDELRKAMASRAYADGGYALDVV
jgi:acyl-CoA dehydrogenase family protein 9